MIVAKILLLCKTVRLLPAPYRTAGGRRHGRHIKRSLSDAHEYARFDGQLRRILKRWMTKEILQAATKKKPNQTLPKWTQTKPANIKDVTEESKRQYTFH